MSPDPPPRYAPRQHHGSPLFSTFLVRDTKVCVYESGDALLTSEQWRGALPLAAVFVLECALDVSGAGVPRFGGTGRVGDLDLGRPSPHERGPPGSRTWSMPWCRLNPLHTAWRVDREARTPRKYSRLVWLCTIDQRQLLRSSSEPGSSLQVPAAHIRAEHMHRNGIGGGHERFDPRVRQGCARSSNSPHVEHQ